MTTVSFVEIENFRGISHLRYEPKQVNVLIGRNNSGKTTILEAIFSNLTGKFGSLGGESEVFYRTYDVMLGADSATIMSNLHTVSLYRVGAEIPYHMKMTFNAKTYFALTELLSGGSFSESSFDAFLKFIQTHVPFSVSTYDDSLVFFFDPENTVESNPVLRNTYYELFEPLRSRTFETGSSKPLYVSEIVPHYGKPRYNILSDLQSLVNKDTLQHMETVVKVKHLNSEMVRGFDDSVRLLELERILKEYDIVPNLERLNNREVVYKSDDGSYAAIPYAMHGDGFCTLLNLFYQMYDAKGGVLLIEEPENHMHPGYLSVFVEQLMTLAKKLNIQVFLTSHSYDLIDEFARYPMDEEEEAMIQITNVVRRNGEHELYNHSPSDALRTMDTLKIDLRGT